MNYKIVPQKHFLKEIKRLAKKYRSLKQDLQVLQDELSGNPLAGVDLGGGLRKLRMALGSKTAARVTAHVSSPIHIRSMKQKALSTSSLSMIRKNAKTYQKMKLTN